MQQNNKVATYNRATSTKPTTCSTRKPCSIWKNHCKMPLARDGGKSSPVILPDYKTLLPEFTLFCSLWHGMSSTGFLWEAEFSIMCAKVVPMKYSQNSHESPFVSITPWKNPRLGEEKIPTLKKASSLPRWVESSNSITQWNCTLTSVLKSELDGIFL